MGHEIYHEYVTALVLGFLKAKVILCKWDKGPDLVQNVLVQVLSQLS